MAIKYIVYYLDERDLSEDEMCVDFKTILEEVEGESRFDTEEEAIERAESINFEVTILKVYCK